MKWCNTCVLPSTRPNLVINSSGVCNACEQGKEKKKINWRKRKIEFENLVRRIKKKKAEYDCLIPVSGGKDSVWQVVIALKYGLKPLTITWKTPERTLIGEKNLKNLVSLGVNHIDFTINPKVESKFMLKTFEKSGSPLVPMHLAIYNLPVRVAYSFKIPLIIWGENSAFEYGGLKNDFGANVNDKWIKKYGATNQTNAKNWISKTFTEKDLSPYMMPKRSILNKFNVEGIFLGYFFKWDPINTMKIAKKNGFLFEKSNLKTGLYNFADIDDNLISIHHWMKWYKFGFTRYFDNLSIEIRNNRIKRKDAIEKLKKIGDQKPNEDIEKFCKLTDINKIEFEKKSEKFRNKKIWFLDGKKWKIKDFLIDDWIWK